MATIAAADIGGVAAEALRKADFSGVVVRELIGPRDLTMPEATGLIGKAIGKPDLPYVRFPDEGYVAGLESAGFQRPTPPACSSRWRSPSTKASSARKPGTRR